MPVRTSLSCGLRSLTAVLVLFEAGSFHTMTPSSIHYEAKAGEVVQRAHSAYRGKKREKNISMFFFYA